ncbi:MAG: 4Fe-4S dicluster domain-containing protein [bacterium]
MMNNNLLTTIEKASGQNVNLCYQCKKCTSGCPMLPEMDLTPTQIIHALVLGMNDLVLKSKTIWLCASCETCITRCPQQVDLPKVMDALRMVAMKQRIKPALPEIPFFYNCFIKSVRLFGTSFELALGGIVKLKTKGIQKELPLTIELLKRGKLNLFPSIKDVWRVNQIFRWAKNVPILTRKFGGSEEND